MIAFIKGEVIEIQENKIILESSQIGYNIFMPGSTLDGMLHPGDKVKIYTYLNVREDAMQLYGFLTKEEAGPGEKTAGAKTKRDGTGPVRRQEKGENEG